MAILKAIKSIESKLKVMGTRILVDVADTILFLTEHESVSGIQRVLVEVWKELDLDSDCQAEAVAYRRKDGVFCDVSIEKLNEIISMLESGHARGEVNQKAHDLYAQLERADSLVCTDNDVLLVLGSPWINQGYFARVNELRDTGLNVVTLLYDLIPLLDSSFPEASVLQFIPYVTQLSIASDRVATISQSTRDDYSSYAREVSIPEKPGCVTQLPGGLDVEKNEVFRETFTSWPNPYVLMVGTIEQRKNHVSALKAWKELISRLGIENVPDLVCVGRIGWNVSEFIDEWLSDEIVKSKIHLLHDQVNDSTLRNLYQDCLFTIYPSQYEGWGLPISESLDFGKAVISSNTSSMPEAGGEFVAYVDPLDHLALADEAQLWIKNPEIPRLLTDKAQQQRVQVNWKKIAKLLREEAKLAKESTGMANVVELTSGKEFSLAPLSELPSNWAGEIYLRNLQERRSLPMTGQISNSTDYALAALAISGDIDLQHSNENGLVLSSPRSSINFCLRFTTNVMAPFRVLLSTGIGFGSCDLQIRTLNEVTLVHFQPGTVISIPVNQSVDSDEYRVYLKFMPKFGQSILVRSCLILPENSTQDEMEILRRVLDGNAAAVNRFNLELTGSQHLETREILDSLSWKITKPLRYIHSKLKSVRKMGKHR